MIGRAALVVVALAATVAGAAPPSAPGGDDARRIERGETVVQRRAVEGYPWPDVVAYRRSSAPPTAVMAVYADFAAHASWVPQMVESRVVAREAPNVFRVFYESEVTGPNERYTVTVRLARDGDGWAARWTLVTARYARRLEGGFRVVPRGEGSLLMYSSLVDPGTLGGTLGTPDSVASRLAATTEALAARTEALARSEPRRLADLVAALTDAAGGER
jgi:hypothetical protein